MKRKPWKRDRRIVEEFFEKARKLETSSPPKKHHLVPEFYLRRWANENDRVRVTNIDDRHSYVVNVEKAARETDFYSLDDPEANPKDLPGLTHEQLLSVAEGWGQDWIRKALDLPHLTPPWDGIDEQITANFAWFLALTATRGRTYRQFDQQSSIGMFRAWVGAHDDDMLRTRLVDHGVEPTAEAMDEHRRFRDRIASGELAITVPRAKSVARSGITARDMVPVLLDRRWAIVRTTPMLPTCDEPSVAIGGPGARRDTTAGLVLAAVVIVPLAPDALLAMFHNDIGDDLLQSDMTLQRDETLEIAREIIANSNRSAFEHPTQNVTTVLRVPPRPPNINMPRTPTTRDGQPAQLISASTPTRFTSVDAPPWPVERWWRHAFRYREVPPPRPT